MYIENNPENSTLLVEAITVDPSSVTLPEMHKKTLSATVYPESVLNKEVEWSSSDTSIATVNSATGEVCAKKEGGPVTIYATACDGSGVYGTCQVTVGPPIPVQGVHILDGDFTMYQGETKCPYPLIYPGSASNRAVMWCSSDPSVASVGLYTGEVWAVGPGTATITVTTLDGGFTSSITVTVYIDEVIVRKEASERYGPHIAVEFKATGKIWRCVFADLVHSGDAGTTETNRAKENFYEGYPNNTVEAKHYSDDELKLLYAIDPHGVAYYIYKYALEHAYDWSTEQMLAYKDQKFRMLFGRDPLYFERCSEDDWCIARYKEPLSAVMSEAEAIFGSDRMIWDEYTTVEAIQLACTFVAMAVSAVCAIPGIAVWLQAHCVVNSIVKVTSYLLSAAGGSDLIQIGSADAVADYFNGMELNWAGVLLNTWLTVAQIKDNIDLRTDYERDIHEYCANSTGFEVKFTLEDGEHTMQELCNAFAS